MGSRVGGAKSPFRLVGTAPDQPEHAIGVASSGGRDQPETLAAPVSMCPVKRRDQAASMLTVTVKSYQPLQ
jgi:hypothetical protein